MAKIAEVLDIQRSYSNQVELRSEYFDLDVRTDRMAHYKPIRAHRAAFEKIAEGIWQQNNKRSYIISGSFGTGKSHLLMMLASYFSTPSTTGEMKKFFENYDQAEKEEHVKNPKAAQLKNLRSEGQFLVSICDYASPDFETNLLRAIRETLELENLDMDSMESAYNQAIDKIHEWEESDNSYFIEKLEELLDSTASKWNVDSLVSDMRDFNVDALNAFKFLYKQITSTDFQYDKDNYVKVISALTDVNTVIRKKYRGWIILFDEFDYQIGEKRFHLEQFQQLLQKCSKSLLDGFPILFVATIHKSFLEYKSVYNAADFSTLSDRFDEIKLESEGIEDIISAVVNPKKDSDIWKTEIGTHQPQMIQLANETNKYHLFDWLRAAQIKGKIIENIYPMHPAATYALIKLAGAAGSNNRSVVSFFAQEAEEPGSYAEYINNTDILTNGDLNLYTVDLLCNYFSLSSSSENITDVAREHIRNYETSLRELYKIRHNSMDDLILNQDIFVQVLKVMVIYDIIGLPNTFDMIAFGLNKRTSSQKSSLESVFNNACEKRIIYLNDTNGCYEFKRSDSKDISGLIRDYKSKSSNLPGNYVQTLYEIIKNDYAAKVRKKLKEDALNPQKYNLQWMEDKRLKKVFCMLKELEDKDYFKNLHENLASETDIKKSFDGAVVYAICEKQEELASAVAAAKKNIYPEIMVAVSNEPADICDDIFSLKAACSYLEQSDDFSTQDIMALKTQVQAYDTKIAKRLDYLTDSRNYLAYTAGGELLEKGNNDEAAVELLEKLYAGRRNTVKNEELNKSHEYKKNNTALRDAVERLLDISQPVSFHNDYGSDRGDIKFIRNILVQCGVIYKYNAQGSVAYCHIEKDVSKYSKFLPALSAMITEIHDSEGVEINIQNFIHKYMKEYGLGYNAILLFMAVVKRYFTDSLTIVNDVEAVGSINVNNMDILKSIIFSSQYVNSIMKYEQISEDEEKYVEKLITIFGGVGKGNLDVLQQLMENWYDNLDPICKVEELYPNESTRSFVEICNQIKSMSIREICLYEFKGVIGMERDTLIYGSIGDDLAKEIKNQKEIVDNGFYIARKKILLGISGFFGQKKEDINAIENKFHEWSRGLDDAQRDVLNPLQNDYSKPIVKAIGSDEPFSDILFKSIPADMKFGPVRKWTSDHCSEYLQTFEQGKRHIEEDVYAVSCPIYKLKGREVEEERNGKKAVIRFSGELILTFEKGRDNICYYVSTDGSDPRDPNAQRIKRAEIYSLTITKDTKVQICGESEAHKFSNVLTLNCVNEEMKYEVKITEGEKVQDYSNGAFKPVKDIKINGIIPVDAESLQRFVRSLAGLMEEKRAVDKEEIIRGLSNAIHDLEA